MCRARTGVGLAVMFHSRIEELLGSNLGQATGET